MNTRDLTTNEENKNAMTINTTTTTTTTATTATTTTSASILSTLNATNSNAINADTAPKEEIIIDDETIAMNIARLVFFERIAKEHEMEMLNAQIESLKMLEQAEQKELQEAIKTIETITESEEAQHLMRENHCYFQNQDDCHEENEENNPLYVNPYELFSNISVEDEESVSKRLLNLNKY